VRKIRKGDTEKGFAEADIILEGSYRTPSQEHAPLETCCSVAYMDEKDRLVIHSKSQGIFFVLGGLCAVFNLPMSKVKFVGGTIGGGFGAMNSVHTDHIAGLLALKTGKPVRFKFTREEEMMYSTVRSPWYFKFKDGVKKDGRIVARQIEVIHDCGGYTDLGLYAVEKNINFISGPNSIDNVSIDAYLVYTNKVPSGSMRGFGINIGQFAEQVQMDKIAAATGIDPFEIRLINAFKEGDKNHIESPLTAVSQIETLQNVAEMSGKILPEKYLSMSSK